MEKMKMIEDGEDGKMEKMKISHLACIYYGMSELILHISIFGQTTPL